VDPDHCKITVRVVSHKIGLITPRIRQGNTDFACAMHHVAIREDKAIGGEDKSRPVRLDFRGLVILRPDRAPGPYFYIDHRRADLFGSIDDSPRISVKKLDVLGSRRVPFDRRIPGFGNPIHYIFF
jgi:hypothetical protein